MREREGERVAKGYAGLEMAAQESVAPFPPPPRYYEDFEPLSNTKWKPPAPPPPIVRPHLPPPLPAPVIMMKGPAPC